MYLLWSVFKAILVVSLLQWSPVFETESWAHGSHGFDARIGLRREQSQNLEKLAHRLEHLLKKQDRNMIADQTAGLAAIQALEDEIFAEISELGTPKWSQVASAYAGSLLRRLNLVELGRWVLDLARRHGPAVGAAVVLGEGLEQLLLVYMVKHPEWSFLAPLYLFHIPELVSFNLVVGGPVMFRLATRLRNYGIRAHYEHLLAQRQHNPFDWSAILGVENLSIPNAENESFDVGILDENLLERNAPRGFRLLFWPKRLAVRESTAAVSIKELEVLVRGLDANWLSKLRFFASNRRVYASLLFKVWLEHGPRETVLKWVETLRQKSVGSAVERRDRFDDARTVQNLVESPSIEIFRDRWSQLESQGWARTTILRELEWAFAKNSFDELDRFRHLSSLNAEMGVLLRRFDRALYAFEAWASVPGDRARIDLDDVFEKLVHIRGVLFLMSEEVARKRCELSLTK